VFEELLVKNLIEIEEYLINNLKFILVKWPTTNKSKKNSNIYFRVVVQKSQKIPRKTQA
jgi:hypothetical protein